MTRRTRKGGAKQRTEVFAVEPWTESHIGDAILKEAIDRFDIKELTAKKAGRQLVRDALLRCCREIFEEAFSGDKGIEAQIERAVEIACKRVLDEGWKSPEGKTAPADVVRRKVEELVSSKVADEFDVEVDVRLKRRDAE